MFFNSWKKNFNSLWNYEFNGSINLLQWKFLSAICLQLPWLKTKQKRNWKNEKKWKFSFFCLKVIIFKTRELGELSKQKRTSSQRQAVDILKVDALALSKISKRHLFREIQNSFYELTHIGLEPQQNFSY